MTCPANCECSSCILPPTDAPKCTKHPGCVGREGHGGPRVGLRRALRSVAKDVIEAIAKRVA